MIESIKELNKKVQKLHYKTEGNWMVRTFLREASVPLTWLLLHTPITANQVSALATVIGLVGISFFTCPDEATFFMGALLLQLWYYLDHVDGQIARYRGTACLTGRFFDFMMHHLIHGVLFFALGVYLFFEQGNFLYILWGFIISISIIMFNLIHDTKYKTFFEKMEKSDRVDFKKKKPTGESLPSEKKPSSLKKIYSLMHKVSEIHVLMNILTLTAFMQLFTQDALDYRANLFYVYGFIIPVISLTKFIYIIKNNQIDKDFENQINVTEHSPE